MKKVSCYLFLSYAVCGLLACSTNYQAPVQEVARTTKTATPEPRVNIPEAPVVRRPSERRPRTMVGSHQVSSGETLIGLAFAYELEYTALARVNGIEPPYVIYPGQILQLNTSLPAPEPASINRSKEVPPVSVLAPDSPTIKSPSPITNSSSKTLNWAWPGSGKVISAFSSEGVDNKGIDISGQEGDAVLAAESGEVIYAGSGLLRYGNLLIIRHNAQFLSAYAHNSKLLVKEGDIVSKGQTIAALGSTGIDREILHFEIRENGESVDPILFLPTR